MRPLQIPPAWGRRNQVRFGGRSSSWLVRFAEGLCLAG